MRHHLTVDVEEYFHPSVLERTISRSAWQGLPRRSGEVIPKILDELSRTGVKATFFVLGWLAQRERGIVRDIARAGHEIASHSWGHERVTEQSPEAFRSSVRRSKELLEDLAGAPVHGFRAPSFSIVPGCEWALDVLLEEGYRYDSSLFPVSQHPTYGYPGGGRDPHWIERPSGSIFEVPPSTARILGTVVPASGGAYFRFLPYALLRTAFREAEGRGSPGTFYIHPWELDDYVPPLRLPRMDKLRTFGRLSVTWPKLRRLLDDFEFREIRRTLSEATAAPEGAS